MRAQRAFGIALGGPDDHLGGRLAHRAITDAKRKARAAAGARGGDGGVERQGDRDGDGIHGAERVEPASGHVEHVRCRRQREAASRYHATFLDHHRAPSDVTLDRGIGFRGGQSEGRREITARDGFPGQDASERVTRYRTLRRGERSEERIERVEEGAQRRPQPLKSSGTFGIVPSARAGIV